MLLVPLDAITITINIDCFAGRHSPRVLKAAITHSRTQTRHTSHAPNWTYTHTWALTHTHMHAYQNSWQLKAVIVFAFVVCSRICDAFMFQLLPLLFYLLTLLPALFFSLTNKLTCHIAIAAKIHKNNESQNDASWKIKV